MMMKAHLVPTIPPKPCERFADPVSQLQEAEHTSADKGVEGDTRAEKRSENRSEHSADSRADKERQPGTEPGCAKNHDGANADSDTNDTDEQLAEFDLQTGADQSQDFWQSPTASKEARWIVHIEVCAAGATEPRERRALVYPQQISFGRGQNCDIQFGAEERTVSSLHAELVRTDTGYVLRDADSRNGLFLVGHENSHGPAGILDPSHGPAAGGAEGEAAAMAPIRLVELSLEVSAQPTEILLGPQGPTCRIRIGDVLPFADYLVTGQLGAGGMATVFIAQEMTGLGRLVVLKLIAPSLLMCIDQKDAQAMLQEEARIASQISHPNVVNIFRAGCYQGSHYIAMEYLRGVNLGSIQRQLVRRRRRCPPDLAAAVVSQALLGLHAAHEAKDASGRSLGIVHRDFTPTNIVCSAEGDVKLIDFGVARAIGRCYLSSTGQFVGKPAYASPEQIQRPKTIDRRSDVFAAGIILYELCTGQPLFLRDHDFATMAAVISDPIPPLTQLPEVLAAIISRALSRDPDDRPPTAEAMAEELERFVLSEGGRYLQRKYIAKSLRRLGVNLIAPTPRTLVGRPTLFPKPKRVVRSSRPLRSSQPEPDLAAAASPSPSASAAAPAVALAAADDPTRQDDAAAAGLPPQLVLGGSTYGITVCLQSPGNSGLPHAAYLVVPAAPAAPAPAAAPAPPVAATAPHLYHLHLIGGGPLSAALPEPYLEQMRSLVQAWQSSDPDATPFGPLLVGEPAWPDGPFALLLPTHQDEVSLHALQQQPLSWSTRIAVAHKLALALDAAGKLRPGFVHGELSPAQIMVRIEPSLRVWLRLPQQLAGLLGKHPARALAADANPHSDPAQSSAAAYRAPELRSAAEATASSDVFAVAAIIFELLGGDLAQAAAAVRSGSRLPPLPPHSRAAVETLDALRAALSPDCESRPILSELVRCLVASADTARAAGGAPGPTLELPLPEPESSRCISRADGGRLYVYALQLDRFANRGPFALPLSGAGGPISVPVRVALYRNTLAVELSGDGEAGKGRTRLYQDGAESGTARLFLEPDSSAFELGSRTQNRLQRVEYQVPADEAHDWAALPALDLRLRLPRRGRAAFLWTRDLRSGDLHVCCVQIAE